MSEFDGSTFNQARDGERLKRQLDIVRGIMVDGQRHTLDELAKAANCSTASASARVRDLRKPKHGGLAIRRFYVSNGTWEYQVAEACADGMRVVNRNELLTKLHDQAMDEIGEALTRLQDRTAEVGEIPRRCDDYHEDHGDGLWWNVENTDGEIQEPPSYIGRPGDSDWPWIKADEPHLLWVPLPKLARGKP